MKRPLKAEDARLWAIVARTVRPAPGRAMPELEAAIDPPPPPPTGKRPSPPLTASKAGAQKPTAPPETPRLRADERVVGRAAATRPAEPQPIEPLRKRRLIRERDEIGARLDLHGFDQDRARAALHDFLLRAHRRGLRAVLVITGKGTLGDGVLRRRAPEWLAEPHVRALIAGVSPAARHHGGDGALYIALKRRDP